MVISGLFISQPRRSQKHDLIKKFKTSNTINYVLKRILQKMPLSIPYMMTI